MQIIRLTSFLLLIAGPAFAQSPKGAEFLPGWPGTNRARTALRDFDERPGGVDAEIRGYLDATVEDGPREKLLQSTVELDLFGSSTYGKEQQKQWAVGGEYFVTTLDSVDPRFPNSLSDIWIAVAGDLYDSGSFRFSGSIGVVNASDRPLSDGDGIYPIVNLLFEWRTSEKGSWILLVNYTTSRPGLPEVPLPAIGYRRQVSDHFEWFLGLPYLYWRWEPPDSPWDFHFGGMPIVDFEAELGFSFNQHWRIFARYDTENRNFHVDGTDSDERFGYEDMVATLGVEFMPREKMRLSVEGGWVFGREFSRETLSGSELEEFTVEGSGVVMFRFSFDF
ncbi:MAG: hypothetical protein AAGD14_13225 [Planctomycetota bacterium]